VAYVQQVEMAVGKDNGLAFEGEATKNLVLQWRIASLERDSSLPSAAQNDIIGKMTL